MNENKTNPFTINNQIRDDAPMPRDTCRMSVKELLLVQIRSLNKRAEQLQKLHDVLPEKLEPTTDNALFAIFSKL